MASISNFGQSGPYRDYRATEIVQYALGGLSYVFGSADREPLAHALNQSQMRAGTNAATAVTAAAMRQQMTGQGERIDVSIQETVASGLRDTACLYAYAGAVRGRLPTEPSGEVPVQPMETQDGYAVPIAFGAADWRDTAEFLGDPRLRDERFSTPEGRAEHAEELDALVREVFLHRGKFETFHAANERRGLIYGVVQSPREVLECPQYRERRYFVRLDHPIIGPAEYPGAPFVMSGTPWRGSRAPLLGEHTSQVLSERLGLGAEALSRLRAEGVV